jgi:hypothetical protein
MTRSATAALREFALALCAAALVAGCATPRPPTSEPTAAPGTQAGAVPRATSIDPQLVRQILALDPEHITDHDVRSTLALGPTPQIILVHGGLYGTHLLMMSFGKFLVGMGYPDAKIRDPSDGAYSQNPFGSAERVAGEIAWYYERDGVRPMLVGHSQGGIQAVKILYALDGAFTNEIPVWNAANDAPEGRSSIVDPLTGTERSVIRTSVAYASVVGAGGMALYAPVHWVMVARLHDIPNSVEDFTGFNIDYDFIALTPPGAAPYRHNGTAQVRNVSLPASYSHVFVPYTQSLVRDAGMRDWINAYVPGGHNGDPPGHDEGRDTNVFWAADVWFSIKKHWCLEAQKLIRAQRVPFGDH